MRSSSIQFAMMGSAIVASALASPLYQNLERRDFISFPSNRVLAKTPSRKISECNASQVATAKRVVKEAAQLALHGSKIKATSAAYQYFMDSNNDNDIGSQRHSLVQNRLGLVYEYLVDPDGRSKTGKLDHPIHIGCGATAKQGDDQAVCASEQVYARLINDDVPIIVLCPGFFTWAAKSETSLSKYTYADKQGVKYDICENTNRMEAMFNMAMVLLHEMMHVYYLGGQINAMDESIDNEIIDCVYGPYYAHVLAENAAHVSEINADSYAWMSMVEWLLNTECKGTDINLNNIKDPFNGKSAAAQPMGLEQNFSRCTFKDARSYSLPTKPFTDADLQLANTIAKAIKSDNGVFE